MKQVFTILFSIISFTASAQQTNKIFTIDIDHFWRAYDSIQQTKDFTKKLSLIHKYYISKRTKGLEAFMSLRDYNDTLYVKLIERYPKFWNSIRSHTLSVQSKTVEFNKAIADLQKLYPQLREAEMYFTIGGLRSGGTVKDNMVLVGAEIATGDSSIDMSEFKDDWLKKVFAKQSLDNLVYLNIHEYIHTQQKGSGNRVLNQCIAEGACDFIAELVLQKELQTQYITYGRNHQDEIKNQFKKEMLSEDISNWLYNGGQKGESADLGYYIGYEICKSYYKHAKNKSKAIKEIIELNYSDDKAVDAFLTKSKFFTE
jgi:hypothetical protein